MCTNYRPSTRDALRERFGVEPPSGEWKADAWRGYLAPIIRRAQTGAREALLGAFGLVPHWVPSAAQARKISGGTMNARAETVAVKPSFRTAWRQGHFCLVPMARFYEPDWRSGEAVRTAISMADGRDFAAAGLWSWWRDPEAADDAQGVTTFSMITVNADGHPVMNQVHRPGDEKRSLVIVPQERWDAWLGASAAQAPELLQLYPPELMQLAAAPVGR